MVTHRCQSTRVAVCILACLILQGHAKDASFDEVICKVGMKESLLSFSKKWMTQILQKCDSAHDLAVSKLNVTEEKANEVKVRCLDKLGKVLEDTFKEQLKNQTKMCIEEMKTVDNKYKELEGSAVDYSESNALGAIYKTQVGEAIQAEEKSFKVAEKLETEESKDGKVRLFSDTFYLPRVDSERAAVASLAGGALVAMVGFGALLRRGSAREQTGQERLVSGTSEAADA